MPEPESSNEKAREWYERLTVSEGSLPPDPQRIVTESKLRALAREKATLDREAVDTFLAYEEYGRLPRPEPTPKFLP